MNRSKTPPIIVGLVEVESARVVDDLTNSLYLENIVTILYTIIHQMKEV